jgi:3-oxoacyl-(acyl-carrier-protein) synthase
LGQQIVTLMMHQGYSRKTMNAKTTLFWIVRLMEAKERPAFMRPLIEWEMKNSPTGEVENELEWLIPLLNEEDRPDFLSWLLETSHAHNKVRPAHGATEETPASTSLPPVIDPVQNIPPSSDLQDSKAGEISGAPAVRRGIRVKPEQMVVSVGRGSLLTTRGTTRATRAAAMHGIDAPITLAYLSEDFGLTRYQGRDEGGRETWVRNDTREPVTPEEIAASFGEKLLNESGIREIPLKGDAQGLPVRHGGLLPEPLRTGQRLLEVMGMGVKELAGTPLENQRRNLQYASDAGIYTLYAALLAQVGFGRPLHELFASSRFGASQGSAFPGAERLIEMNDDARSGKDSVTYRLQSALLENGRGLYLNLIMPHFDFSELKNNPQAIYRILPPELAAGEMPNTGGVNTAFSQACAAALYALHGARQALIHTGVEGEYPMDAMMVIGADATFSPFDSAPAVAGFSRKAPMTMDSIVRKLEQQGLLPEDLRANLLENRMRAVEVWEKLPQNLRRRAMNESSAPFTHHAKGLVVSEGSGAMPWVNFRRAVETGLWPSSRLLGIHVNSGEGGAANLASMDQGIVTAAMVALRMAQAHGAVPQVIQTHGTSTELNNIAEIQSVYEAFRYMGMSHEMSISANKGLVGHTMGAASAVDMVMGVQSLLDGEAPGLFNFRAEDMDPRYAKRIPEALKQFRFSSDPIRGGIENILITSEGFLSSDAAAVLGHFPQDVDQAVDLLRDYNFSSDEIAEWKAKAVDNRAEAEKKVEDLRRGDLSLRDVAIEFGFNPSAKKPKTDE